MYRKIFALVFVTLVLFACKKTPEDNYIPVTGVALNQATAEMLVGETLQLQVKLTPTNATEQDVMWGSSKQTVATVSAEGLVTAVGEGTAIITVTAGEGKTATCNVTVVKPRVEVQAVTLDNDNITILKGQTVVLNATVSPADATDATVTWTTSDEAVAKVDQNGKVTAMGGGNAVIAAAAGNRSADCSVSVTVPVESVFLDRSEISLVEGETAVLTATVLPDDASDKNVDWTSSNSEVATVDSEGKVTAIKEGTATVTAKAGDKTASCTVTVSKKIIHVISITIDKPSLNIEVGATETLTATVLPNDATDKSFTWASTNSTIAEVDQTGKVTAKAAGTVTITATTTDGGLIAACEVTVNVPYIPVENITLSNTTLSLNKGQTATLTAIISPTNATVQTVTWWSTNEDAAVVDDYGKVTAMGGGRAVIIAGVGNITAECVVTVSVPAESIELDRTELSLKEGETAMLQAIVLPDDATDKTITWTTTNANVAIVDSEGKVTAKAEGSAVITAKSGSATAVCMVTVSKKIIPVSSIEICEETLSLLVGETEILTATVYPDNATDKSYVWSSTNTVIAEVDQTGKVSAKSAGTATITATTTDGGKVAVCEVTVSIPYIEVTDITLDHDDVTIDKGQSVTLIATVKPYNATEKTVSWTSSNTDIATVDQEGKVTAIAGGSATITATAGNKTAICNVIVTVPVTGVTLNKTTLGLIEGSSETLAATITPADATNTEVNWTSSDSNIATVDTHGKVTAVADGSATITVTTADGGMTATCAVTVSAIQQYDGEENGHYYVDLGLPSGLKWATCNVGADSPEDYGDYFAWGEVEPYYSSLDPLTWKSGKTAGYTWVSYKWCNGDYDKLTKYNNNNLYGPIVDNITTLELADDAARVNWQGNWRIPTRAEFDELISSSNCSTEWITQNGVKGRKITSKKNGNSIFLPAAGDRYDTRLIFAGIYGYYWSSILNTDCSFDSWFLVFDSSDVLTDNSTRGSGKPIRPVSGEGLTVAVSSVSLNKTSTTLNVGDTETLTATVSPSNATNKSVTWTSSNTSVATVSSSGVVTAKADGTTTITVTTNDGGKTATCAVTVRLAVTGVSVSPQTTSMYVGDTKTLTATVSPSNAPNKAVTWTSSKPSVATVSSSGVVTAKSTGNTTITVRTEDGGKTATCTVTVYARSDPFYLVADDITLHTHNAEWCEASLSYKVYESGTNTLLMRCENGTIYVSSTAQSKYSSYFSVSSISSPEYIFGSYNVDGQLLHNDSGLIYWRYNGSTLANDIVVQYQVRQRFNTLTLTATGSITILSTSHSYSSHTEHASSVVTPSSPDVHL